MKNPMFLFVLLFSSVLLFGQTNEKVYAEKSGKVVYHYEIDKDKTDFTLIFDDYGNKQILDITTYSGGESDHVKTIILPEKMMMVNYGDKQVVVFPTTGGGTNMATSVNMGIDVPALVNNAKSETAVKKGMEKILGKECMVFEHSDGEYKGKYWIFKNYLLKAEFLSEGVHTYMEAKELKIDIDIPSSEFEAPQGFAVTDMSKQMQMMEQMPDNE